MFDFEVVSAGAAGSVMAARLSETPRRHLQRLAVRAGEAVDELEAALIGEQA